MTASRPSNRPYIVISADTHAGASIQAYREYLDDAHKQLFDEWRGTYRNPQRKHIGSKKHKNWDDVERMRDMDARRRGRRDHLPEHRAAVLPSSVLICGNPSRRELPALARGHPRAQPLAGRLVRRASRAARGDRARLPERHRRRDRGRAVDREARPARRRAAAARAAGLHAHQAALRARLRPLLGGVPGPRRRGQPARRHGLARLRRVQDLAADPAGRDGLVLDAELHAPAARGRLRALPEAPLHRDRVGLRLGAVDARSTRLHVGARAHAARWASSSSPRARCRPSRRASTPSATAATARARRRRASSPAATRSASTTCSGAATTRTTRALSAHARSPCATPSTTCPSPRCARCSARTPRSSTASTSPSSRRSPRAWARRRRRSRPAPARGDPEGRA